MDDRLRLTGHYDDEFYWEPVDRNLGWLGETVQERSILLDESQS